MRNRIAKELIFESYENLSVLAMAMSISLERL